MVINNKIDFLKLSQVLITFLAAAWIVAGIYAIMISASHKNSPPWVFVLMGALMLLDAAMLFVFSNGLKKQSIWSYRFLIILLIVNALLTFADQVGLVDLIVFFLALAPLTILIFKRTFFVKPPGLR